MESERNPKYNYAMNMKEYKAITKYVNILTCVISMFCIVSFKVGIGYQIIKEGLIICTLFYVFLMGKTYLYDGYKFDYFDELIWIYNKFLKKKPSVKDATLKVD